MDLFIHLLAYWVAMLIALFCIRGKKLICRDFALAWLLPFFVMVWVVEIGVVGEDPLKTIFVTDILGEPNILLNAAKKG